MYMGLCVCVFGVSAVAPALNVLNAYKNANFGNYYYMAR